jgi:hypothetical protein
MAYPLRLLCTHSGARMSKLSTALFVICAALTLLVIHLQLQLGHARETSARTRSGMASVDVVDGVTPGGTGTARGTPGDCESVNASRRFQMEETIGMSSPSPRPRTPAEERLGRAEVLASIKREYADFLAVHELDRQDTKALHELLLARELEILRITGHPTESAPVEFEKVDADFRRRISTLIAEQSSADLDAYRRVADIRSEISELSGQLEAIDAPLTSEQRRQLVQAAIQDFRSFAARSSYAEPHESLTDHQSARSWREWKSGQWQRFLGVARGVLHGRQLQHLEDLAEVRRDLGSS